MQTNVLWASPDDSVGRALERMRRQSADYMMVGRDGAAEGIVSMSDIKGTLSPYLRPEFAKWCRPLDEATLQIKLKWIMSKSVHTVNVETSLPAVMQNMRRFRIRCLPVTDLQNRVQGLVTVNDILTTLLRPNACPRESIAAKDIQAAPAAHTTRERTRAAVSSLP
jgi:acetoin utilization protein AcuB